MCLKFRGWDIDGQQIKTEKLCSDPSPKVNTWLCVCPSRPLKKRLVVFSVPKLFLCSVCNVLGLP